MNNRTMSVFVGLGLLWGSLAVESLGAGREADVKRLMDPVIAAGVAPGAVVGLLEQDKATVLAFGHLAADGAQAPDGRTVYEIGSISKVFTGILLADAVRRGEVALEDPLSRHLPEGVKAPQRDDQNILLWHLATHTSGLPRVPTNMNADGANPYAAYTVKDLWAYCNSGQPDAAPGQHYAYSNLGAGLLGTLLAERSGKPYEQLLAERITEPLKMTDTTVALSTEQRRRLAAPHAGGIKGTNWDFDALVGCGGIRSTVDDMLLLARATLSDRTDGVYGSIALSTRRHFTLPQGGGGMALGWHIAGDGSTLWHNGQTGGYHCAMFVNPLNNTAAVVLSNSSDSTVGTVAERLIQLLAGMPVVAPKIRSHIQVATEQLDKLVGEYPSQFGFTIYVTRDGAALFARLTNQSALRVWPETATRFFYREVEADLQFEIDAQGGQASAVTLFQNGMEMRCVRKNGT